MGSKVILTENSRNHLSRLITAAQSIKNLEDYSEKPKGVWGCKAIIKCGNITIDSSELDVEFTIPFDDNLEVDEGEIIVYNLVNGTISALKTGASKQLKLTIEAGFEGDTGVIFEGKIAKVSSKREGADRATTIKVKDGFSNSTEQLIAEGKLQDSYDGVEAKQILQDLLLAETELNGSAIAKFEVKSNYQYENSVSISDELQAEIKKHSEICGVSTFKSKGRIYCCALEDVANGIGFNVSEETGMIDSPSPFEEVVTIGGKEEMRKGFDIEMLLQHRAAVGAVVNLNSEDYKGKYYVKSGTHRFNISEATTSLKVVEK